MMVLLMGFHKALLLSSQITHLQIMMKMDIMQKKTVEMIVMTMMQVYTWEHLKDAMEKTMTVMALSMEMTQILHK